MSPSRFTLSAVFLLLLSGALATSVHASGAGTIAGAPIIVFGKQQFGNLASATKPGYVIGDGAGTYWCNESTPEDLWTAPVVAGDHVRFDWEGSPGARLLVLPVGTTDFNVAGTAPGTAPVAYSVLPVGKSKSELIFVAPKTGSAPVMFCSANQLGPYDFTGYVRHALRLAIESGVALQARGTVAVHVRDPDGRPISAKSLTVSLQVSYGGRWKTIGQAAAARGVAKIVYDAASFTPGRYKLRARAHGSSYATTTLPARTVQVA